VLSAKLRDKELLIVDALSMDEIKTKVFKGHMDSLGLSNALVITPIIDTKLELSSRNLQKFKVLRVDGLNCYDLLRFEKLVLLRDSLEPIEMRLVGQSPNS
jgi:large subunit ribosomal protein L4